MCYYEGQKIIKTHKNRKTPIKAYKVLYYSKIGNFESPHRGCAWHNDKMVASEIPYHGGSWGIYAFKNQEDAVKYGKYEGFTLGLGFVVVEIAIYGTIIEFAGQEGTDWTGERYPGYIAEHAKVKHVVKGISRLSTEDKKKYVLKEVKK